VIDRDEFKRAFRAIVDRFGRKMEPKEYAAFAASYYEFLSGQMDTDTFLAAARTIWATAKWFPRPCDFMTAGIGDEWRVLTKCLDEYHAPEWKHTEFWAQLSGRAQEAVKRLGGLDSAKALMGKDALRLKAGFEAAYEQATASEVLALPSVSVRAALPAA
jgi:hypothetical protein